MLALCFHVNILHVLANQMFRQIINHNLESPWLANVLLNMASYNNANSYVYVNTIRL